MDVILVLLHCNFILLKNKLSYDTYTSNNTVKKQKSEIKPIWGAAQVALMPIMGIK